MKANLTFNLDDPDDAASYRLHSQAKDLYFAMGDIQSMLRSLDKYEEFPAGSGLILDAQLSDKEKELQWAEQQRLEAAAQLEYEKELQAFDKLSTEEQKKRSRPIKPFVPKRYRLFDSDGKCMITGHSMVGIIRDLMYDVLTEAKVDLEVLS